jgi:hypothetical protein
MKELRNIQFLGLTILILLMGWIGWWIIEKFFSNYAFSGYVILPLSYYIAGVMMIEVLYRIDKTKPLRLAQAYLIMHTLKFLTFGGLALYFILALDVKSKLFMVVYAIYYLVFIVFETLSYYSVEKQLKKQNQ